MVRTCDVAISPGKRTENESKEIEHMNVREIVPWLHATNGLHSAPLWALQGELSRFFDEAFALRDPAGGPIAERPAGFSPKVNVAESSDAFSVTLEVPGIDEKDIKVTLKDRVLAVSGERKSASHGEEAKGAHYRESSYGTFRRTIRLGAEVSEDQVAASLKNGVLTITLPKKPAEECAGKTIAVRAG